MIVRTNADIHKPPILLLEAIDAEAIRAAELLTRRLIESAAVTGSEGGAA